MTKCGTGEHVFGPWEDVDLTSKNDEQKKRRCTICGHEERIVFTGGEGSPVVISDDGSDMKK